MRISVDFAEATMRELEQLARAHGLDEERIVEEALLLHLRELRERPPEAVVVTAPPGPSAHGSSARGSC